MPCQLAFHIIELEESCDHGRNEHAPGNSAFANSLCKCIRIPRWENHLARAEGDMWENEQTACVGDRAGVTPGVMRGGATKNVSHHVAQARNAIAVSSLSTLGRTCCARTVVQ